MFVAHICKNALVTLTKDGKKKKITLSSTSKPLCNNAWTDVDTTNARKPPTWKYCAACVAFGYKNPDKKPIDSVKSERARANLVRKGDR